MSTLSAICCITPAATGAAVQLACETPLMPWISPISGDCTNAIDEFPILRKPWNVLSTPCIQYSAHNSIPTTWV